MVLVLPGGRADLGFVRLVAEEDRAGRILGLDDLLLLSALWQGPQVAPMEGAQLIQKPEAEARAVLRWLVEAGLVETRGGRREERYRLSGTISRRLRGEVDYGQEQGIELLQQEQVVREFIKTHGKITRAQVAALCQLTSSQVRHFLSRLVEKGVLVRQGIRRGTFYVLASKTMDMSKKAE